MSVRNQPRAGYISSIVEAGTATCRLYGPSKTNVADIALLLGKSPASIYKIFPSKAAIWDAIAGNFFETDLRFVASADLELANAACRLREAALGQHRLMLQARHGDHQMFKLVVLAAEGNWPSFRSYLKRLHADMARLIHDGIETQEFAPTNVEAAASCFCAAIIALCDPRIVGVLPSSHCEISAQELVAFAVASLASSNLASGSGLTDDDPMNLRGA
ncbi:TetR family transcriptional regulator [Rhizobium calliandrae]|uniref:TetR family transcriptional regulator n=1 Tax=Rhizobium calliandrae TaxID=1312182 RepID=A0ABT7KR19_9HYPH|nr:TetR family transcriptional regulator [Rhizobium calliandrae]MDL2410567.1 TetR family transcriptional regulator [Rhizobium calliandrae]